MVDYITLQFLRFLTLRAYKHGDWKKVPIKENGQSLVIVPSEIAFPFYHRVMKLANEGNIYLRQKVLEKVLKARSLLNEKGFDLKVYDGWRSVELQENLFWHYMRTFTAIRFNRKEEFNNLVHTENFKEYFNSLSPEVRATMVEANKTYVSWPSKDSFCPSPHATGGSVDVWLFKDGEAADLGVPFDWMEEEAGAFYHLKLRRKRFFVKDEIVCRNRETLLGLSLNSTF